MEPVGVQPDPELSEGVEPVELGGFEGVVEMGGAEGAAASKLVVDLGALVELGRLEGVLEIKGIDVVLVKSVLCGQALSIHGPYHSRVVRYRFLTSSRSCPSKYTPLLNWW